MKIKILLITILLLFSCSHLKVIKFNDETYPPTSKIDVYQTKLPDKEYIEIAKVTIRKKGDYLETLIEEAKKIGADGLILLGDEHVGEQHLPAGYSVYSVDIQDVGAIAIKYINIESSR